jgi:predicted dienelactone hydrolase
MHRCRPGVGSRVNRNRIGAAGFSLGGYTVSALAGARTDPALLRKFCASPAAAGCGDPPEFPNLFQRWSELEAGSSEFRASAAQAGGSYRDPRIRAAFAIAPALGPALISESLAQIGIPFEIVGGQNDEIAPPEPNARFMARLIRGGESDAVPGRALHLPRHVYGRGKARTTGFLRGSFERGSR